MPLVLTLKPGEIVYLNKLVEISYTPYSSNQIRLRIVAPAEVDITRSNYQKNKRPKAITKEKK